MKLIDLFTKLKHNLQAYLKRLSRQAHLKRLSRSVHGGRMDPNKFNRIHKARVRSCLGELRAARMKIKLKHADIREALVPALKRKHNLAPRGPKHNTTRQEAP